MYQESLERVHAAYSAGRSGLILNPHLLIEAERVLADSVAGLVASFMDEVAFEYDAASLLYPFWKNYPPESRGRMPIGDQFPWIEVGEHTLGTKLARKVDGLYEVSDLGFPTGADQRFVVSGPEIEEATRGLTDSLWLCVDIKSVGPRDDSQHAVMSHNQVSGSGEWDDLSGGVVNDTMLAQGRQRSHDFYPALPPLIVLPNGTIAPTVTMALKPVYKMLPWSGNDWSGQPLDRVELIVIPNGLLLTQAPGYLRMYPGLLFPGKDDKTKPARKLRARVSFPHLNAVAPWRVRSLWVRPTP